MQFIKTLFWVILAVVLVVFAINNWVPTTITLWDGLRLDTKLPLLVIGAFLLGFVPLYLVHRTTKWRLKKRIATLEASQSVTHSNPLNLEKNQITNTDTSSLETV